MFKFSQVPPLSMYVHLPWCVKKCPYCDFNSHAADHAVFPEAAYVDALIRDLEFELPALEGRRITSIFIGGGTPSLFSAEELDRLFTALRTNMVLSGEVEITLEANPGTYDAGRFRAYRDIGINRLSIGVQSFNDRMLTRLGRIHDAGTAGDAVRAAADAGFERINLDLMYGLPGQTVAEALADVNRAIDYGTVHLSWYQLTIEPNTVFYKQRPELPEPDAIWEMQEAGQNLLAGAGYRQYEVSAYAREGYQCRHNLNYWEFGDYLGLGAGAHGKLTDVAGNAVYRLVRHRLPESYMRLAGQQQVITNSKTLTEEEVILEFMMNALRLNEGFDTALFRDRTGLPVELIEARINRAVTREWLEWHATVIKPTAAGRNYLNDLLMYFMPDGEMYNAINREGRTA
jgi:oxygen-independent coproporphyrinogen-3 oxidase